MGKGVGGGNILLMYFEVLFYCHQLVGSVSSSTKSEQILVQGHSVKHPVL